MASFARQWKKGLVPTFWADLASKAGGRNAGQASENKSFSFCENWWEQWEQWEQPLQPSNGGGLSVPTNKNKSGNSGNNILYRYRYETAYSLKVGVWLEIIQNVPTKFQWEHFLVCVGTATGRAITGFQRFVPTFPPIFDSRERGTHTKMAVFDHFLSKKAILPKIEQFFTCWRAVAR
jgi:hypothetical protein